MWKWAETLRAYKLLFNTGMKIKCPYCHLQREPKSVSRTIRVWAKYRRKSDGQILVRYRCSRCGKTFSAATTSEQRGQNKRQLNKAVVDLLTSGVSQREAARLLKINKKTIVRKFRWAGRSAARRLQEWNQQFPLAEKVQFDDMETFEHSKLKPVSITLMVEEKTRRILGLKCSQMPAKGHFAKLARKKYGRRPDHRPIARDQLFTEMKELVNPFATIRSDSNPHYLRSVKKHFPQANYVTVLGGRAAVVGQGEMKKLRFDPIFSLNHTCAMIRDHLKRLARRSWCTTKRIQELEMNLQLYALKHNLKIATS